MTNAFRGVSRQLTDEVRSSRTKSYSNVLVVLILGDEIQPKFGRPQHRDRAVKRLTLHSDELSDDLPTRLGVCSIDYKSTADVKVGIKAVGPQISRHRHLEPQFRARLQRP